MKKSENNNEGGDTPLFKTGDIVSFKRKYNTEKYIFCIGIVKNVWKKKKITNILYVKNNIGGDKNLEITDINQQYIKKATNSEIKFYKLFKTT